MQKSEQFQQSDVTGWGIAALVCAGIAVVGANVGGLIPSSTLNALHSPRNDAASLSQLRQQVAELRTETAQLRRQNEVLTTRFALQEQSSNEVVRRVGALEVSLPALAEMRPATATIDRSVTTASITNNSGQQVAAEGGTVVVRQSPLQQPLPAPIAVPSASSGAQVGYAVVVGASFANGQAPTQWHDLQVRLGSLVIDMSPLVTDGAGANQQRLILGPIAQMSEARDFCLRLEQMEIACSPTSFAGAPIN